MFSSPPLAGRPPYAIDDNATIYSTPTPQSRVRQQPAPDPNSRSSAYNMYDQYMDDSKRDSGADALGMGFMNGGDSDSDDEEDNGMAHRHNKHSALAAATHPQSQSSIPLASPRPGYAAPIAALNLSSSPSAQASPRQPPAALQVHGQRQAPPPMLSPGNPQMAQLPSSLRSGPSTPNGQMSFPLGPPVRPFASSPAPSLAPSSVPSTPHPLEAPMTPITPAFLRPPKSPAPRDKVKFETEPILRGNSEDNLIPKRGEQGDMFWKRFSMIAQDGAKQGRESSWLVKTQSGTNSLSRWVWVTGIFLLCCIGGGIGLGWFLTHNNPSETVPDAIGGSANQGGTIDSTTSSAAGASSTPHVSPTLTVQNRAAYPQPYPTNSPFHLIDTPYLHPDSSFPVVAPKRLRRHTNRTHH